MLPQAVVDDIIFPNLFSDKLKITTNYNELSEITIYDLISRKLVRQNFTNSIILNTESLSQGMYIYEVRNKKGVIKTGKVLKD